jgi:Rho termination factor, N-terminal domain
LRLPWQFARALHPPSARLSEGIDAEHLDPWGEAIGNDLRVEDLPVEDLPVEDLPVEDLPMSGLDSCPIEPIALSTLFALTVPQLRGQAKQLGLKNYSRQSKAQLLVAIRRHLEGVA